MKPGRKRCPSDQKAGFDPEEQALHHSFVKLQRSRFYRQSCRRRSNTCSGNHPLSRPRLCSGSLNPLYFKLCFYFAGLVGRVVMQRPAKPCTPVRFRY